MSSIAIEILRKHGLIKLAPVYQELRQVSTKSNIDLELCTFLAPDLIEKFEQAPEFDRSFFGIVRADMPVIGKPY